MPKRIRFSVKIQKIKRIKTRTADRDGRQKVLSMRLSVGIWYDAFDCLPLRDGCLMHTSVMDSERPIVLQIIDQVRRLKHVVTEVVNGILQGYIHSLLISYLYELCVIHRQACCLPVLAVILGVEQDSLPDAGWIFLAKDIQRLMGVVA